MEDTLTFKLGAEGKIDLASSSSSEEIESVQSESVGGITSIEEDSMEDIDSPIKSPFRSVKGKFLDLKYLKPET